MSVEYLFLVPVEGEWTQASIDGVPIKTTDSGAYVGMPKIRATPHVEYLSWEEHIEETVALIKEDD